MDHIQSVMFYGLFSTGYFLRAVFYGLFSTGCFLRAMFCVVWMSVHIDLLNAFTFFFFRFLCMQRYTGLSGCSRCIMPLQTAKECHGVRRGQNELHMYVVEIFDGYV